MIRKMACAVAVLAALQGCASVGVEQMTVSDGLVTSARNGYPYEETPRAQINQRDSLIIVTHVRWDPLAGNAGKHDVVWTWYEGEKVVAVREKQMQFEKSPYRMSWRMPAADFDPGHYRVVVSIDRKIVETREYDIVKRAL